MTAGPGAAAEHRSKLRVTWAGAAVNLPLGLGKVAVGFLANSQALVADGVHSISDVASDVVVLVALRGSGQEPDRDHPYGHGRFETLATLAVALLLLLAALGILVDALSRLRAPADLAPPGLLALVAALVSIGVKEALYRYTMVVARRTRSSLLATNAWHHRSDALSSVVALVGIGGSLAGLVFLDAVAAVLIAVLLARIAWIHGWPAVRELADTGIDADERARILREAGLVPGVRGTRDLRARRLGPVVVADLSILLDPRLTLSEAHRICEAVKARLIDRIEELGDVVVHAEPSGHADGFGAEEAALRAQIVADLGGAWEGLPEARAISDIQLHYLSDGVEVDVVVPMGALDDPEAAERRLSSAATQSLPEVRRVRMRLSL